MAKVLWFDTETTGLKPWKHGIIQLACIVEIDGVVHERRNFIMNPVGKEFDPGSAKAHGKTLEEIEAYPDMRIAKKDIENMLSNYVNKYDKNDKFIPAGFNVQFDIEMLSAMWKDCGDDYFFSWMGGGANIDPFQTAGYLEWAGLIPKLPKRNLTGMCQFFGVTIEEAHNAVSDIEATRELALVLKRIIENGGMAS